MLERRHIAGKEISERKDVAGDGSVARPRPLRAVENKVPESVAMIKLFQLRSAEFATEAELVFAYGVGGDVGEMSGDVFAAFRRGQADPVKAGNLNVRRAGEVETVVEVQAIAGEIEVGVEVAEDLPEIVHSGQQLVR